VPYTFSDVGMEKLTTDHIYPNEQKYDEQLAEVGPHGYPPVLDKLEAAARERGLWNLFLPHLHPDAPGTKLSNLDHAPISEELGKVTFAAGTLNCSAPDTGNMEVLNLYGSERVKRGYLTPLLEGYAHQRTLRIADDPDEVHKMTVARREILKTDPGFRMMPARL
jgi:acyl-CoA dehydrogenase